MPPFSLLATQKAALLSPFQRTPLDVMLGRWTLDTSPMFVAMDLMSRVFSPYDLNPGGSNPLHEVLTQNIDFTRLARAPNVHTGRGRVSAREILNRLNEVSLTR
jgi:NTE family protein